jgi:hypothetical protein
MQKYKIYLLLSMANRHWQVRPSLAGVSILLCLWVCARTARFRETCSLLPTHTRTFLAKPALFSDARVLVVDVFADRIPQDAKDEYKIAGAPDRDKLLLEYKARIDKMTPVSVRERMLGALWGTVAGDALGMVTDGSVRNPFLVSKHMLPTHACEADSLRCA